MTENLDNNLMDRLKVLEMIESGKISVDEGASLLNTLGDNKTKKNKSVEYKSDPRWFRVRVSDTITGKNKATVNIPFGLMDWGLKIGAQFAPEVSDIDLNELRDILKSGFDGKILDVIDDEDGEHVEIYVD